MQKVILMAILMVFLCSSAAICANNSNQASFAGAGSISTPNVVTAFNLHRVTGIVTDIDYGGQMVTITEPGYSGRLTILEHINNAAKTTAVFKDLLESGEVVTVIYEKSFSFAVPKKIPNGSAYANAPDPIVRVKKIVYMDKKSLLFRGESTVFEERP